MLTIERFYFNYEEATGRVSASSDGTDFELSFIGSESDGVSIVIRMRGVENYRRLIEHISAVGRTLVDAHAQKSVAEDNPPADPARRPPPATKGTEEIKDDVMTRTGELGATPSPQHASTDQKD